MLDSLTHVTGCWFGQEQHQVRQHTHILANLPVLGLDVDVSDIAQSAVNA